MKIYIEHYVVDDRDYTISTNGPSIFLTFLPSHQDMRPANIETPQPNPMKAPVAQD